jgi:hypothetical protein
LRRIEESGSRKIEWQKMPNEDREVAVSRHGNTPDEDKTVISGSGTPHTTSVDANLRNFSCCLLPL